jgi:hypothetical protein
VPTNRRTPVDELNDSFTGVWDEEIVKDTFHPLEAQKILEIPISPNLDDEEKGSNKNAAHLTQLMGLAHFWAFSFIFLFSVSLLFCVFDSFSVSFLLFTFTYFLEMFQFSKIF